MAAGVNELQSKLDILKADFVKLQTSVDDVSVRKDAQLAAKDAQILALNTQAQTDAATIKQLQDQIAAGGTAPDLQSQVDQTVMLDADVKSTTIVLDNI